MYKDKKVSVIIPCAGKGTRMKTPIAKQFLDIRGMPILAMTVRAFDAYDLVDEIILITHEDHMEYCKKNIIEKYGFINRVQVVAGGQERQDSVWAGINCLDVDAEIVLIHDGVRPFVTQEVIEGVLEKTYLFGAAVAAVPVKDTIKVLQEDVFIETPERKYLYHVQTPQGFDKTLLRKAYEKAFQEKFYGTDDAVLVERLGEKVYFSMGDYNNRKITTAEDLPQEGINIPRVGIGYDVHALIENRKLILGGVEIPCEKGLEGHSDADVLIHALMDAMLGAAALGDIGKHFPDTKEEYRGISSMKLLEKVGALLKEKGYVLGNADITLIAEKPKIAKFTGQMKKNIQSVLYINENQINIKGTTTEKLGFCGRGEGIAAEAVVLLVKQIT